MHTPFIALLVTLVAGACLAQDAKPQKKPGKLNPFLQRMDKDGNGNITIEGLPCPTPHFFRTASLIGRPAP